MAEDLFPQRGEVWLVDFPDDPKSRPALIVSLDARNQFSNSVLAVPLTTNLRPALTHVLLNKEQGGIAAAYGPMRECELRFALASAPRRLCRKDQSGTAP